MSRSNWKGPFIEKHLLKQFSKDKDEDNAKKKRIVLKNCKTMSRQSTILPGFCDNTVSVYNGKQFVKIKITKKMVGHKFGEFISTRRKFFYKKTKKK